MATALALPPACGSLAVVGEDAAPEISLVLASDEQPGVNYEVVSVLPEETIKDLKLRLRSRGLWSTRNTLVFGSRELADHQRIADAISGRCGTLPSHMHVFVKLNDVETVAVRTLGSQFTWDAAVAGAEEPPRKPPPPPPVAKSALTESLADSSASSGSKVGSECAAREGAARHPLTLARRSSFEHRGATVVHLLVHRKASIAFNLTSGDKFELSISSSDTADTLKQRIAAAHGSLPAEAHQLLFGGEVLESNRPLASYGIGKGSLLELVPLHNPGSAGSLPEGCPLLSSPSHELYANFQRAKAGLAEGHSPVLASAGTGGSYFLQDPDGRSVVVFKPEDEEPLAANNPKGLATSPTGEGLRKGTRPGEGAVREVAAYILDHGHFAGVPPTALVSCELVGNDDEPDLVTGIWDNSSGSPPTSSSTSFTSSATSGSLSEGPAGSAGGLGTSPPGSGVTRRASAERKTGSLQLYVKSESDCEERGPSQFPVHEVHKICVLDIRLANTDRNGGNILARRNASTGQWELIPIDHGYTLPASLEDINLEWLWWPQASLPFERETLHYIAALDAEKDIELLQAHGLVLRPECLRVLRCCTMLLKKGAAVGLTARQIGEIMTRLSLTKSPLEKLSHAALQRCRLQQYGGELAASLMPQNSAASLHLPVDDDLYLANLEELLDEYLADFAAEESDPLAGGGDLLL